MIVVVPGQNTCAPTRPWWGFRDIRGLGAPRENAAGASSSRTCTQGRRRLGRRGRQRRPPRCSFRAVQPLPRGGRGLSLRAHPDTDQPPLPLTRATCLCPANLPAHDPTSRAEDQPPRRARGRERGARGTRTRAGESAAPFKPQARSAPFRWDSQGLGTGVLPQPLSPVRRCQG